MTARFLIGCSVMLALCAPAAAVAEDAELPLRKAGYWEIKTVIDEGGGPKEQMLTMCIDAAKEAETAKASRTEHEANCARYQIKREGEGTVVDADCTYGGLPVSSRTEMSGDFQSAFAVKIESTVQRGNRDGQTVPQKRTITQAGTYLGAACAAGLQPGEAMGTDGKKVVVQ